MQLQGRLVSTWTEIVYDGRGYRLAQDKSCPNSYRLTDQSGEELMLIKGGPLLTVELSRALPLALLVMVVLQVGDEAPTAGQATEPIESPY